MRRLFNIWVVVSTLICLLALAIWVRGFFVTDVWVSNYYNASTNSVESRAVETSKGWVIFVRWTMLIPNRNAPPSQQALDGTWRHDSRPQASSNIPPQGNEWFFSLKTKRPTTTAATRAIVIPAYRVDGVRWLLIIGLSSLLPGLWFFLNLRSRRVKKSGCCTVCGYDLRASPDRCPECGTAIETKAGKAN